MKTSLSFYRLILLFGMLILGGCSRQYMGTPAAASVGTMTSTVTVPPTNSTPSPSPARSSTPVSGITDEPDCHTQAGQVIGTSIPSSNLKEAFKFHIYLPPCYDLETTTRYPVLYLIHGQSYDDNQWIQLGVPQAADKLIGQGEPPFIVVMPFDKYHYRQPATDPFDEAFINELVPYIDGHYRTIPERTSRAVGGLSRGGGWALHLALNYPMLFGAFGGHSLAILDEDGPRLSRLLDAIPEDEMPRFYMDIGKSDGLRPSVEKFEAMLTQRGIPHEWYINPGFHNQAYWSKHVEDYLKWYTSGWSGEK